MTARLRDWLSGQGLTHDGATIAALVIAVMAAIGLVWLVRHVGGAMVNRFTQPDSQWHDRLSSHRVYRTVGSVLTLILLQTELLPVLDGWTAIWETVQAGLNLLLVIAVTVTVHGLISAAVDILEQTADDRPEIPVRVLGQALQVALWVYAAVIFASVLTGTDVTALLTSLTALGAVAVYIFRDMILGWTAGIQLAAYDLARVGDWITAPTLDADGVITEIALTSVKVRNWDKTMSAVPSYALVSAGFRNWRGVSEAGARRLKRAVLVDATTIRHADAALVEALDASSLLHRETMASDRTGDPVTNLTLYRRWLHGWLRSHPLTKQDETLVVRQLAPTARGVPVECYLFTHDTRWVVYEGFLAQVVDQAVAMLPRFGLRVYQEPSSADLWALAPGSAHAAPGPEPTGASWTG